MSTPSQIVEHLEVALIEAKLVQSEFHHITFVEPGTKHGTQVNVEQSLSIAKRSEEEGLMAIARVKLSLRSTLQDAAQTPHYNAECEYLGVFAILEADSALVADAKVNPKLVDKACRSILSVVVHEVGSTLSKSGLALPLRWSIEALKENLSPQPPAASSA